VYVYVWYMIILIEYFVFTGRKVLFPSYRCVKVHRWTWNQNWFSVLVNVGISIMVSGQGRIRFRANSLDEMVTTCIISQSKIFSCFIQLSHVEFSTICKNIGLIFSINKSNCLSIFWSVSP